MNLYYLNQKANSLRAHAKNSLYARWELGELLHDADMKGYSIEQNRTTGKIIITDKKGGE